MNEISYVVVFPTIFTKNKISQLITNIKKILKIKNQQFKSVKRDGDVILVDANDPVFASSAINLLFGIEKIAIARHIKNNFQDVVSEITSVGGNLPVSNVKNLNFGLIFSIISIITESSAPKLDAFATLG